MNVYFSQEYARHHQAELVREADRARLAQIAREGAGGRPTKSDRRRVVLALGAAAAGILATASAVLGAR